MKKEDFKAVQVSENVYWVGAIDWSIRNFHGYQTNRGTTYNAYIVLADKITLIDTVKAPFQDELTARISSLIDPKEISIIISNHSEMDHSGCLPGIIDLVKPERIIASVMGVKALAHHFNIDSEITAVKDGDTISLGNMDITFIETRMLHWPDSMFSYLSDEKVLFSQDGFGMHLSSNERFTDEIGEHILTDEAAKYFANILLPYSNLIQKIMEKVKKSGIDIGIIAPDHGPVWRTEADIKKILGLYVSWSEQKPLKKAVVMYDTMWQSTDLMARSICEGLVKGGVNVKMMPLSSVHRSDVATEILNAGAIVVGSPTINNNMFPTVADIMSYLKGLKPKNLIGAAFGSYGWSGEAVGQIENILSEMKVDIVSEGVKVKYVPDSETILKCNKLGRHIAEKLNNINQ